MPYDRDLCLRLKNYGKTEEEYNNFFINARKEYEIEQNKSKGSPLIKYPKQIITQLIQESKCNDSTCVLCGNSFIEPELDYNILDNDKLIRLETILKDEQFNFNELVNSIRSEERSGGNG